MRPRQPRVRAILVAAGLATLLVLPVAFAPAASSLNVTTADSPDPVAVDAELTYTIDVTNGGPDAATGVVLTNELANQLDFVSAVPTQGSACKRTGKTITCELGSIAPGASAGVVIKVRPRQDGQITNSVSVASTEPYAEAKTDTETTTVGAAPPVPSCAGQSATIVGTEGADTIPGTDKRDVVVALGGDDVVTGLSGRDIACGSSGNDVLRGQADGDQLRGGTGNDRLRGGGGDDNLRGGAGNDSLGGGIGNDFLGGGLGDDSCRGGPGADTQRSC